MLYKYTAVLDINPMEDNYDYAKDKLDNTAREFGCVYSSLQEMSIKEQLKFYIDKNIYCSYDKDIMLKLVDKL